MSHRPWRVSCFAVLALCLPGTGATAAVADVAPATTPAPASVSTGAGPTLPANTVIELELLDGVGSALSKPGDRFRMRVAQDVSRDGRVLIPAGTEALGAVVHAQRAGAGGKGGELILAARHLDCAQGPVRLRSSFGAAGKHRVGASIATGIVVGPFAMLIRGKNVELPAGSPISARLAEDTLFPATSDGRGATVPPNNKRTATE